MTSKKEKIYLIEGTFKRDTYGNPRKVGIYFKKDKNDSIFVDSIKTYSYEDGKDIGKKIYKGKEIEKVYIPISPNMSYTEVRRIEKNYSKKDKN